MIKNLIRFGKISSVNPKDCTCRVVFGDRDNLISAELPVLMPCAFKNKAYALPDVDESVVCLMMPNDDSGGGFILGSFFHDKSAPPVDNQDISMLKFEDGTKIFYDRRKHELRVECVGKIFINGSEVHLNE